MSERALELIVPAQKIITKYGQTRLTKDGWTITAGLVELRLGITANTKRRTRDLWVHSCGAEALRVRWVDGGGPKVSLFCPEISGRGAGWVGQIHQYGAQTETTPEPVGTVH